MGTALAFFLFTRVRIYFSLTFIYVFDFSNPGFRASKNRATARFFERISFLYPQDGALDWIRTSGPQSRSYQAVNGKSPKMLGFVQSAQKSYFLSRGREP